MRTGVPPMLAMIGCLSPPDAPSRMELRRELSSSDWPMAWPGTMRVTQPGGIEKVPFFGKKLDLWRRRFSPAEAQEHAETMELPEYSRALSLDTRPGFKANGSRTSTMARGTNPRGTQTFIFSHPLRAVSAPQSHLRRPPVCRVIGTVQYSTVPQTPRCRKFKSHFSVGASGRCWQC